MLGLQRALVMYGEEELCSSCALCALLAKVFVKLACCSSYTDLQVRTQQLDANSPLKLVAAVT